MDRAPPLVRPDLPPKASRSGALYSCASIFEAEVTNETSRARAQTPRLSIFETGVATEASRAKAQRLRLCVCGLGVAPEASKAGARGPGPSFPRIATEASRAGMQGPRHSICETRFADDACRARTPQDLLPSILEAKIATEISRAGLRRSALRLPQQERRVHEPPQTAIKWLYMRCQKHTL